MQSIIVLWIVRINKNQEREAWRSLKEYKEVRFNKQLLEFKE